VGYYKAKTRTLGNELGEESVFTVLVFDYIYNSNP